MSNSLQFTNCTVLFFNNASSFVSFKEEKVVNLDKKQLFFLGRSLSTICVRKDLIKSSYSCAKLKDNNFSFDLEEHGLLVDGDPQLTGKLGERQFTISLDFSQNFVGEDESEESVDQTDYSSSNSRNERFGENDKINATSKLHFIEKINQNQQKELSTKFTPKSNVGGIEGFESDD